MNQSSRGRGGKRARNNPELAQVVIAGSSQCSYVLTERQFLVQDDPKIPDRSGEEKVREFSRKGLRVQYGNIVWAATYSTRLNCLTLLQKRAIRIVAKDSYCAHTWPRF